MNRLVAKPLVTLLSVTVVLAAAWPPLSALAQQTQVPWSVELYPDNSDYILLKVDARKLPPNVVLSGISCTVEFFKAPAGRTTLGKETLALADEIAGKFRPGAIYGAYLLHSHAGAQSVKGVSFDGMAAALGGKADDLGSPKPLKLKSKGATKFSKPSGVNITSPAPPPKNSPAAH